MKFVKSILIQIQMNKIIDHKVTLPLTQYEDSQNHHTHLPMPGEGPSGRGSQRVVNLHSIIANKSELIVHDNLMICDGI